MASMWLGQPVEITATRVAGDRPSLRTVRRVNQPAVIWMLGFANRWMIERVPSNRENERFVRLLDGSTDSPLWQLGPPWGSRPLGAFGPPPLVSPAVLHDAELSAFSEVRRRARRREREPYLHEVAVNIAARFTPAETSAARDWFDGLKRELAKFEYVHVGRSWWHITGKLPLPPVHARTAVTPTQPPMMVCARDTPALGPAEFDPVIAESEANTRRRLADSRRAR